MKLFPLFNVNEGKEETYTLTDKDEDVIKSVMAGDINSRMLASRIKSCEKSLEKARNKNGGAEIARWVKNMALWKEIKKRHDISVVEKPKEKNPKSEFDEYFVVYAANGRHNGWAVVRATGKGDARKIMSNNGWLEQGRVTNVETFSEYCKEMAGGSDIASMEAEKAGIGEDWPKEIGDYYEYDWGT